MNKQNKKEKVQIISLMLAVISFFVLTIIWFNSPMKGLFIEIIDSANNAWWNDKLISGTLGYIGLGMIGLIIYPVPILCAMIYRYSNKHMGQIITQKMRKE